MSKPRRIIVNGKFLGADQTGVHRVATELVRSTHAIIAEDPDLSARFRIEVWAPRNGRARAEALGVPFRIVGPFTGIAWEQITLPSRAGGDPILSLCNVGPLAYRNGVTIFHDAQVYLTPASYSAGFRMWYRFHQPIVGRRHRRILTVSEYSREQLARYGIARHEKIGVIANGVDHLAALDPDDTILSRHKLTPGRYVVALANTQPHKNIALLLKAFADDRLADLDLALFGPAGRASFAALGHNVPGNVRFVGKVSDAELLGLYRGALCLAFPSTTEGFGLPPVEAMTMSCPAVVAPAGALPQVCGDAAVYAHPERPGEWVDAIEKMATDEAFRQSQIQLGHERAASFTWKNAATRLIAELETILPG